MCHCAPQCYPPFYGGDNANIHYTLRVPFCFFTSQTWGNIQIPVERGSASTPTSVAGQEASPGNHSGFLPPLFPCSTHVLLATRLDRFFLWWDNQTFDLDDLNAGWPWLYWVASVSHRQRLLSKDVLGQALMNPLSTTQHPPRPILQLNPIWHHYLPSFGQENVCLLIYIAWIERQIQTNLKA